MADDSAKMTARMARAVLILPGTAVVLIPALILWASAETNYAGAPAGPGDPWFWAGLVFVGAGVYLGAWSASLFVKQGRGTPAPWDPPQRLVVLGPYRHVRNPMLSGVISILLGEAMLCQSWPLAGWWLFFFAANAVYFPLIEEKGLEKRFGEAYRIYKENVPRWLPRPTPWQPPDES